MMNCGDCTKSYIKRANLYCLLAGRVDKLNQCPDNLWITSMKFYRNKVEIIDLTDLWKDQKVFLLCNGPSRNTLNLDLLYQPGVMTMTINNGGHSFRSNFWTAMDSPRKFMSSIFKDPKIMKFVNLRHISKPYFNDHDSSTHLVHTSPNVIYIKRNVRAELDGWFNDDDIGWNTTKECGNTRCSMLAAIHILYVLGFRTIYIIGADFEMNPRQPYCFSEIKGTGSVKTNNTSFSKLLKFFKDIQPELKKVGLQLFDAQGTRLSESLPTINYTEAVNNCVIDTSASTFGRYDAKR